MISHDFTKYLVHHVQVNALAIMDCVDTYIPKVENGLSVQRVNNLVVNIIPGRSFPVPGGRFASLPCECGRRPP